MTLTGTDHLIGWHLLVQTIWLGDTYWYRPFDWVTLEISNYCHGCNCCYGFLAKLNWQYFCSRVKTSTLRPPNQICDFVNFFLNKTFDTYQHNLPSQTLDAEFLRWPAWHSHIYEPTVFIHVAPLHSPGIAWHSSISAIQSIHKSYIALYI